MSMSAEKAFVGVDIGTSAVKIVELKRDGAGSKLATYGLAEAIGEANVWQNEPSRAAALINQVCHEAGVKTRLAVSALPTFAVFSSILNLGDIGTNDMTAAVHWEAKKVVPLPLEEMILDWRKVEDLPQENAGQKVLLTGAPKSLVKKYIEIFKEAKMPLASLETETFSLIRSLVGNDKSCVMLVEIGASTTDISIVDKSIPMFNRSLDYGGSAITHSIMSSLGFSFEQAEQYKCDLSFKAMAEKGDSPPPALAEAVNPIINEVKYSLNLYQSKNHGRVEKIVLTGGSSLLAHLSAYLAKVMNLNVIIGSPWSRIHYQEELKPLLDEVGPRLAVAAGLALRGTEK